MAAGRGCSAPVTRGEGVSGDSRAPIGGRHLWTRHAQSGRNETSPQIPNHQVQNQLGDPVPLTLNSDNDFSKRLTRPAATNLIKVRLPGPRPHPPGAWPPGRWRPRPGPPLAPPQPRAPGPSTQGSPQSPAPSSHSPAEGARPAAQASKGVGGPGPPAQPPPPPAGTWRGAASAGPSWEEDPLPLGGRKGVRGSRVGPTRCCQPGVPVSGKRWCRRGSP